LRGSITGVALSVINPKKRVRRPAVAHARIVEVDLALGKRLASKNRERGD
jgi:hypothetical protein